jgi:hypothetical protein
MWMNDPYAALNRLFVALVRVSGFTLVFLIQVAGYLYHRRRDKIFDAFGYWGRAVTDTFADMLRK